MSRAVKMETIVMVARQDNYMEGVEVLLVVMVFGTVEIKMFVVQLVYVCRSIVRVVRFGASLVRCKYWNKMKTKMLVCGHRLPVPVVNGSLKPDASMDVLVRASCRQVATLVRWMSSGRKDREPQHIKDQNKASYVTVPHLFESEEKLVDASICPSSVD